MHRDSSNSWKSFSASCWLWKHYSLQEVVKMLEEVVVGWQKVRWTGQMRQNFIAQFVQLLKYWLYNVQSGVIVEKNWALFGDQHQKVFSASHWFAEHILQMEWFSWDSENYSGSEQQQITKQWPWPCFWCKLALGSALELLFGPVTELVITGCCIKSTCHCTSQSNWEITCCCIG